MHIPKLMNH